VLKYKKIYKMEFGCSSMEDKKILNTWIEVMDSKSLKESVIEDNPDLKDFDGLVLKKMHKSDLEITYENFCKRDYLLVLI